jgi:hypothetical protein
MKTKEKRSQHNFWVTNFSNRNVTLSDLAITLPAFRTINLMDTRHYQYTMEQLCKSAETGSLFIKKDKIFVRRDRPDIPQGKYIDIMAVENRMPIDRETNIPSRERSTFIIKEEKYEELQISDEEFANENAETANMDMQPLVIKKG